MINNNSSKFKDSKNSTLNDYNHLFPKLYYLNIDKSENEKNKIRYHWVVL